MVDESAHFIFLIGNGRVDALGNDLWAKLFNGLVEIFHLLHDLFEKTIFFHAVKTTVCGCSGVHKRQKDLNDPLTFLARF